MKKKIIQHIRTPLPRRGGNSFYRDTRDFVASTYCGAAVTYFDVNARDVTTKTARAFYATPTTAFVVCATCKVNARIL